MDQRNGNFSPGWRATQQFSITLPLEVADAVKAEVAAGKHARKSEVIRVRLRVLLVRERVLARCLREQAAPAHAIAFQWRRSLAMVSNWEWD